MPTANITTSRPMATTALTHSFIFPTFFWIRPKITATRINNMEMDAALPLAYATPASSSPVPTKVPATISVKAAITNRVNSQQNSMNNFLPVLPMYFSMIIPIDFPSFFTEAYRAPKSCTAPKNKPPIRSHRSTGTHPNTDARMGPVTGPAPAIEEN